MYETDVTSFTITIAGIPMGPSFLVCGWRLNVEIDNLRSCTLVV